MSVANILNMGSEVVFALCGVICFFTAFKGLKNKKAPYGTFLFWAILGFIFMFGGLVNNAAGTLENRPIPAWVVGALIIVLAILSFTKQVQIGEFKPVDQKAREESSKKLKNWIFVPALTIGVVVLVLSFVTVDGVALPSALAIGLSGILALLIGFILTKAKAKETIDDVTELVMAVGPTSILPQLLTALGTIFTVSGVGTVIATYISMVIPEGNYFFGVLFYLLGMVIFTIIMGNAFAAFSVITVGIGIPFVISQGGDPALVGALALTGGYCGTLITPMAANFNIVPVSVLEIKDKYKVIKSQLPVALIMFVLHVILMYFFTR